MNNISYYKLQAKNLFHDIKLDFMQDDENYVFAPKFFEVNAIVTDFDVDCDNFSLMKAQHVIAKMTGFNSWDELIKASDELLETRKNILESYKIVRKKIYSIDLSGYEKITPAGKAGDYLVRCPRLPEFEEIISQKPDCLFMSCPISDTELNELSNDTKHIYVNVCPMKSTIRVLVPGKKFPDRYAVHVKNIG